MLYNNEVIIVNCPRRTASEKDESGSVRQSNYDGESKGGTETYETFYYRNYQTNSQDISLVLGGGICDGNTIVRASNDPSEQSFAIRIRRADQADNLFKAAASSARVSLEVSEPQRLSLREAGSMYHPKLQCE